MNQYGRDFPEAISRRFGAFHEAGHAVIGIGLGVPFSQVWVSTSNDEEAGCVSFYDLSPTYVSRNWRGRYRSLLAKAAAAGPLAEIKFLKSLNFDADYALAWSDADLQIYGKAAQLPNEFHPLCAPWDSRVRDVQALLERPEVWSCVERLAQALEAHHCFSCRDAIVHSGMAWKSIGKKR